MTEFGDCFPSAALNRHPLSRQHGFQCNAGSVHWLCCGQGTPAIWWQSACLQEVTTERGAP